MVYDAVEKGNCGFRETLMIILQVHPVKIADMNLGDYRTLRCKLITLFSRKRLFWALVVHCRKSH